MGRTALHEAALLGQVAVVLELLSRLLEVGGGVAAAAALNARDWRLQTPLHYAAAHGHVAVAAALLGGGADANALDACARTPLALAVMMKIAAGARCGEALESGFARVARRLQRVLVDGGADVALLEPALIAAVAEGEDAVCAAYRGDMTALNRILDEFPEQLESVVSMCGCHCV